VEKFGVVRRARDNHVVGEETCGFVFSGVDEFVSTYFISLLVPEGAAPGVSV